MLEWMARHRINEYSDLLGLAITIVGFTLTLWNLWRSRRIAAQALNVAQDVRKDLSKFEIVAQITNALNAMADLKRLHRKGDLEPLMDKYSNLRLSLIEIRGLNADLTAGELTTLQSAVSQLAQFERRVERALGSKAEVKVDFRKMNYVIAGYVDEVHAILVRLKAAVGG